MAPFTQADQQPAPPARDTPPLEVARRNARHWTDKTKTLLEQFDPPEAHVIALLVNPRKTETSEQHYQWAQAIVGELADPNGAIIFTYTGDGVDITSTDAAHRIKQATRTQVEALTRAKRLAPLLERPTPRTFNHVCADPALAALIAAGLGRPEHQTSNDAKETLK